MQTFSWLFSSSLACSNHPHFAKHPLSISFFREGVLVSVDIGFYVFARNMIFIIVGGLRITRLTFRLRHLIITVKNIYKNLACSTHLFSAINNIGQKTNLKKNSKELLQHFKLYLKECIVDHLISSSYYRNKAIKEFDFFYRITFTDKTLWCIISTVFFCNFRQIFIISSS